MNDVSYVHILKTQFTCKICMKKTELGYLRDQDCLLIIQEDRSGLYWPKLVASGVGRCGNLKAVLLILHDLSRIKVDYDNNGNQCPGPCNFSCLLSSPCY